MALSVPKAPGVAQMMKDGARVSKINKISLKKPKKFYELLRFFCENVGCLCVRYAKCAALSRPHVNVSDER